MTSLSRIPAWVVASILVLAIGCQRNEKSNTPNSPQARSPDRRSSHSLAQEWDSPGRREDDSLARAGSASEAKPSRVKSRQANDESDSLFTTPTVLRIHIEINRAGMSSLRHTPWGNGQDRPMARATIREGGVVYSNVAVHLKGAAGSFRQVDDRPALTLNFDKLVPGQSFHGLHKISLNNSVQDPSYLCEKISRELFLAAGVPVPRAGHALVDLNGRDLGLYVLLEGANKQFLKRYFSNPNGNLYDGGFCRDIGTSLLINSGEDRTNHSGLLALCDTVRGGRPSFAKLQRVLDVDRFMSMIAIEVMICHWDGYTMNRNNWRLFHDLDANRMVFIPHGLDQLFGNGRQAEGGDSLLPQNVSGDVARALFSTREGVARYRERAAQVYTNVFRTDQIVQRVDEIVAGIAPVVAQTHPQLARTLQQQANWLEQRILHRGEVLARHLGTPTRRVEFARDDLIHLEGWKPVPGRSGSPTLTQIKDGSGRTLLSINAGAGTSSSSWRTRVVLPHGRYQLSGRLRVNGVVIDQGDKLGGADLRISKGAIPRKVTGTSAWTDCEYPFEVEDESSEVEFICELRAASGEAWFDTSSLKLVRLP